MNGAESLIRTLVDLDVTCCFANPGTSEMHLVQAIDATPGMRAVAGLFEGVCTGAADGYARMLGKPATTLLHLGPGLGNGIANLHNARRAGSPLINLIGDHAVHHIPYDAPLTSDIETLARPVSAWVRTARSSTSLASDGLGAARAAMTKNPVPLGNVATLVVPADCSWGPGHEIESPRLDLVAPARIGDSILRDLAQRFDASTALLLDGAALSAAGLQLAARIAAKTGCRCFAPLFAARGEAGPGLPGVPRLPYFPEQMLEALQGTRTLVLAGAEPPVSFFAYPDVPSRPLPADCQVLRLVHAHEDVLNALERLADTLAAKSPGPVVERARPPMPNGALSSKQIGMILGAMLPDECIVTTDSGGGIFAMPYLQASIPHTWLNVTGGSIGQAAPLAIGAAVASPERQVVALLGDGAAMYTPQSLWTQARENQKVITVIYANHAYAILQYEYRRLGTEKIGAKANSLFDMSGPRLDWVALANGMGVPGRRADDCAGFAGALGEALASDGPYLIQADIPGL